MKKSDEILKRKAKETEPLSELLDDENVFAGEVLQKTIVDEAAGRGNESREAR